MRTTEVPFLIVAALLHGGIPLASRAAPRAETLLVARSSGLFSEIEIEVRPVEPLPREPRPRVEPRVRPDDERDVDPDQRRRRRREAAAARGSVLPDSEAPGPEALEPPEALAPAGPTDEYGGPPPPAVAPGLDGVPVWALPGVLAPRAASPAAPTAAPARPETPVDKAGELLRESMRSKDKALGLDLPAAGTVASIVADAVRASDTPDTARATFEVRLSGAGRVLGVRAASFTSGAADLWAKVARAVTARLASRALLMTSAFTKGATVYVSVVSAMKMPSGARSGGVHPNSSGFGFDVADLGARPQRVVTSSFRVVAID